MGELYVAAPGLAAISENALRLLGVTLWAAWLDVVGEVNFAGESPFGVAALSGAANDWRWFRDLLCVPTKSQKILRWKRFVVGRDLDVVVTSLNQDRSASVNASWANDGPGRSRHAYTTLLDDLAHAEADGQRSPRANPAAASRNSPLVDARIWLRFSTCSAASMPDASRFAHSTCLVDSSPNVL